jgi:hypothetical protein
MSTTSLSTVAAIGRGLRGALQWRLWLLWALFTLGCALLAALPAWGWLGAAFDHNVHAAAIANGDAPMLVIDAFMARNAPLAALGGSVLAGSLLMLLASPLLAGATIAAIRTHARPGFGDLLRGAIREYGPMLRMLLWSAIPLGIALGAGAAMQCSPPSWVPAVTSRWGSAVCCSCWPMPAWKPGVAGSPSMAACARCSKPGGAD